MSEAAQLAAPMVEGQRVDDVGASLIAQVLGRQINCDVIPQLF